MASIETLLLSTLSDDNRARREAEAQLEKLSESDGFVVRLLQMCGDGRADPRVRLSASIMCKHSVKKSVGTGRPPGSKCDPRLKEIKTVLMKLIGIQRELLPQVEKQIILTIAETAKFEWPFHWKDLFPSLGGIIKSKATEYRGLSLLDGILEELANLRMREARVERAKACQSMLDALESAWTSHMNAIERILDSKDAAKEGSGRMFRTALILSKCLQKLVLFASLPPFPLTQPQRRVLPKLLQYLRSIPGKRKRFDENAPFFEDLTSLSTTLALTVCRLSEIHPLSFVPFLRPFFSFACEVLQHSIVDGRAIFEEFSILCIRFLRNVLKCPHYLPNAKLRIPYGASEADVKFDRKEAALVNKMQKECGGKLIEVAVTKLMPMTERDCKVWRDSPEEYFHAVDRLYQYESLRPAAEALFWDLIKYHKDSVGSVVVKMLRHTLKMPPLTFGPEEGLSHAQVQQILYKDALYYGIGLASYELAEEFKEISIAEWFGQTLAKELGPLHRTRGNGSFMRRVLQRRVVWLLGEFAPQIVELPKPKRLEVCKSVFQLLASEDVVVRLTALSSFKSFIEATPTREVFEKEFGPVFQNLCSATLQIALESREAQTKTQILGMLQFVFSKAGPELLSTCIPSVVACTPKLWRLCEQQNVVRSTVLYMLKVLVGGTGAPPEGRFLPFLLGIIEWCLSSIGGGRTRTEDDEHSYLHNSAIELWLAAVQNASVLTKECYQLFNKCWYPLACNDLSDQNESYVEGCLSLVGSYALASPPEFVDGKLAGQLLSCIKAISKASSYRLVNYSCAVDNLLSDLCILNPQVIMKGFGPYISKIIQDVVQRDAQQPKSGMMRNSQMTQLVVCNHFHLLARVVITFPQPMIDLLCNAYKAQPQTVVNLLKCWISTFMTTMVSRSSRSRCRMNAAALAVLMKIPVPALASNCLNDVLRATAAALEKKSEFSIESSGRTLPREEEKRRQIMERKDPCETLDLSRFVVRVLKEACEVHGPQMREALKQNDTFRRLLSSAEN